MSGEDDYPVWNASGSANRTFARTKVAEYIKERASHDERPTRWVEKHTENGTLAEIRVALGESGEVTEG